MPSAARLLCSPASRTNTRYRARPSTSAALSPAAPPPMTMQSHMAPSVTGRVTFGKIICHGGKHESVDALVRRRLRELRARRGLTLAQVAERANIDVSTLSRWRPASGGWRWTTSRAWPEHWASAQTSCCIPRPSPDPRVRGKPRRFEGMTMWELSHETDRLRAFKVLVGP